jgi:hypothetical protein
MSCRVLFGDFELVVAGDWRIDTEVEGTGEDFCGTACVRCSFVSLEVLQQVSWRRVRTVPRNIIHVLWIHATFLEASNNILTYASFRKFTRLQPSESYFMVSLHPSPYCFIITCFEWLDKRSILSLAAMSCMARKTKRDMGTGLSLFEWGTSTMPVPNTQCFCCRICREKRDLWATVKSSLFTL